jgi:predicted acylesterase/phospholipase RssA
LDAGREPSDPVRILAVDGGGMRGVMPARVLVELERLAGRPIASMFDIIAGTSTGGLIALGLTRPGPDGKPALTAQQVLDTYLKFGKQIFPRVQWRPLRWEQLRTSRPVLAQRFGALASPTKYGNARYSRAGLTSIVKEMFGETRLSEAMGDVIVPSYDWKAGRPFVFRSRGARNGDLIDPTMAQVALATTAAPTYFPAFRLRSPQREMILIDGGVVANNPTSIAYYETLYHSYFDGQGEPSFLAVSLGTGVPPVPIPTYQELWSRSWLRVGMGMLGVVFDGSSEITDELLTEVVRFKHPGSRYWRLNTELNGVRLNLDDASAGQIDRLIGLTERMLDERKADLDEMIELLTTTGPAQKTAPPTGEEKPTGEQADAQPRSKRNPAPTRGSSRSGGSSSRRDKK